MKSSNEVKKFVSNLTDEELRDKYVPRFIKGFAIFIGTVYVHVRLGSGSISEPLGKILNSQLISILSLIPLITGFLLMAISIMFLQINLERRIAGGVLFDNHKLNFYKPFLYLILFTVFVELIRIIVT